MKDRIQSFVFAGRGVLILLRSQRNAWIHAAATIVVVALGLVFGVGRFEWCALVLAMALVWGAEALNTALELLADATVPNPDPLVGKAKDVAAGGVLLCAVAAAVVGVLAFWPYASAFLAFGGGTHP